MEQSLRRFTRRILLLHLGLLAAVLTILFFASRAVWRSARAQALEQAEQQQRLLVSQTASGLRGYYDSIFGDLDLLKPVDPGDEDTDDRIPEVESGDLSIRLGGPRTLRLPMLSSQLNGRVSHLFMVEKQTHIARPVGKQAATPTIAQIVVRNQPWIDSLERATITPLQRFDDRGYNLIGVPSGARRNSVLVAAVPVRTTARRFFDEFNRSSTSGAFLLDERLTIMAASRPDLIGASLADQPDPQVSSAVSALRPQITRPQAAGEDFTQLLPDAFALGNEKFAPAMVTIEPMRILDKQWYVVIASPLSEVDAVVGRLFRRTILWALSVALAMTAILVSTAVALIRTRMRADRERHQLLEQEIRQAREIQLAWLPKQHVKWEGLDIATVNQPASRISGDFYNWFELPDGRMAVAIGDVTGHGMSAAFLMATTQLLVRNTMAQFSDPGACMEQINRQLCTQVFSGQFVTLQILVLDPEGGRVEIATAGHPPPLLGQGDRFQSLSMEPNLVLAVDRESTYNTQSFELSAGATLVLYTDGVVDANSPSGERFTIERLRRELGRRFDSAQAIVDAVIRAVSDFRGPSPLSDDLTLVAIRLQPRAVKRPVLAATEA